MQYCCCDTPALQASHPIVSAWQQINPVSVGALVVGESVGGSWSVGAIGNLHPKESQLHSQYCAGG